MDIDPRVAAGKQLMGAHLRKLREGAGISQAELARRAKMDRSYLHDIEKGQANAGIDKYAKLISLCGVDFEEFLTGLKFGGISDTEGECRRMLSVILHSGVKELVQGIRVNLEAISEKAARLRTHAPPGPSLGVKHGGETGPQARSLIGKRKKRMSGSV